MEGLEPLLVVQDHDLALDRLRHRHATLAERESVAKAEVDLAALAAETDDVRGPLTSLVRDQQRLEDEAQALSDQANAADRKLYSGTVTSPRELQALQADVEQLKRHQSAVEERALEVMELREPLDARLARLTAASDARAVDLAEARAALATAEAEVDREIAAEQAVRDASAVGVDDAVLALYEQRRAKSASHVGAARLVGHTCQGCHLTIPAVEADALRRAGAGTIAHCDNCGAILVS
jgi:predicted  nucleic acid-binding Zn-ribbon protein